MKVFKRPLLDICVWLECLTFMVFNHVALCEMPPAEWLDGVFWSCRVSNLLATTRGPADTGNVVPTVWMPHYWAMRKEGRWELAFTMYSMGIRSSVIKWMNEKERERQRQRQRDSDRDREREIHHLDRQGKICSSCSNSSLVVDNLKDIFPSKLSSCKEDPFWDF